MGSKALIKLSLIGVITPLLLSAFPMSAVAADTTDSANTTNSNSGFSVLVTPSPIVTTVTPGQTTSLQLKILNNGTAPEVLNIAPKSFSVSNTTGHVNISDSAPLGIGSWLSFSQPDFTINSGEWVYETIKIAVPKDAGFSYYFALSITRKGGPIISSGRLIKASLDDFVLVNVNRPGAKESLSLVSFKSSKTVYQWLPAKFSLRLMNTGNTIVQPSGNIFIKRGANSKTSIDTLDVNGNGGYILPGSDRIFNNNWSDGFPSYITTTSASGVSSNHLSFSTSRSTSFRFGKYNASLVMIYNNGTEDVPLTGSVNFWVLPWVLILILLVIFLIFAFGFWSIGRRMYRLLRKGKKKTALTHKEPKKSEE